MQYLESAGREVQYCQCIIRYVRYYIGNNYSSPSYAALYTSNEVK